MWVWGWGWEHRGTFGISNKFLCAAVALEATLLRKFFILEKLLSTALQVRLTLPGGSQPRRKSERPVIRRGWQGHVCPGLETLSASSPTFRSLTWSNNCDLRLALVVQTEGQETQPTRNKGVKRKDRQGGHRGRKRNEAAAGLLP